MDVKLVSFNTASLRAYAKKVHKNDMTAMMESLGATILCVQEHKLSSVKDEVWAKLAHVEENTESFWSFCTNRKGYCGVVTFAPKGWTRKSWLWFPEDPCECEHCRVLEGSGRVVITDHGALILINVYVVNGGGGHGAKKLEFLRRLALQIERFKEAGREVVLCGDLNLCRDYKVDCYLNEQEIAKHAQDDLDTSFREPFGSWIVENLEKRLQMIDTFHHFHSDLVHIFTYWDQRKFHRDSNQGWRIDYFYVTDAILKMAKDASVMKDVLFSDHCPISLQLTGFTPLKIECKVEHSSEAVSRQKSIASFFAPKKK